VTRPPAETKGNSSRSAERSQLAGDLQRAGYIRGWFGHGGSAEATWFETELVLTRPGILRRCAAVLSQGLPERTDRLAAHGAPALLLAGALSLQAWIPLLFLRADLPPGRWRADSPQLHDHVRGELFPGARVLIVEDVVLTGDHALEAITDLRQAGLEVIGLIGLLDRERGGRFRIEEEGVPTFFAFRERDLQTA
jgi:orotate phosphoribosyltransferase